MSRSSGTGDVKCLGGRGGGGGIYLGGGGGGCLTIGHRGGSGGALVTLSYSSDGTGERGGTLTIGHLGGSGGGSSLAVVHCDCKDSTVSTNFSTVVSNVSILLSYS